MSRDGNILMVANWESDVGYAWWLMEDFWLTIDEYFSKQGMNCYLAYPKINKIPESIVSSNIKVIEHDFKNKSISRLWELFRIIRREHIKYIYLTDYPSFNYLYMLLKFSGVRLIVVHDHTPGDRLPPSGIKKATKYVIQRIPLITADHFIAVTNFVYKRFIDVACIPEKKCSCAQNGIVPIDLTGADSNYAQNCFAIPSGRKIIISTGRATHYKGIEFFIECAREIVINNKVNSLHFIYCGDGPNLDYFKELVMNYKLTNYFTFGGNRSDIRDILPSCDIAFHAAVGEVGYSLSILEYMSAGLLTIVPDRPSTSMAIEHNKTGLVYKQNDISSATNTILGALERNNWTPITENAKLEIYEKYNLKNTRRQLTDIMKRVINIQ